MVLGLDWKSMVLLTRLVFTAMMTFNYGRTNMMYGIVLLVNLSAYIFMLLCHKIGALYDY